MSPSRSIVFFQFPSKVQVLILLFTFFQFYSVVSRDSKVDNFANSLFFFFCRLSLGLVFWPRFGDPCVFQSPIGVYVCYFLCVFIFSRVFLCNLRSGCIDASTLSLILASPLPSSFLDTYSLSMLSLGCKAFYMVISFLVPFVLSSSLVYLRKGLEYLTRGTAQVFIPLNWFRPESFVSSSFLVLLRYPFEFCLSFPLILWCQPPRCPSISPSVLILS